MDRLLELPALFRGGDLTVLFSWDSKRAAHYIWLWKRRGLIESLGGDKGGHSNVYANLVKERQPNWEAALLMARPSAIITGIECLRRSGWTTQAPRQPEVAIDKRLAVFKTDRFELLARPEGWYKAIARAIVLERGNLEATSRTAPALRPAWALADMLARENWGNCGVDPSDIYWDMATARDLRDWERARVALKVPSGRSLVVCEAWPDPGPTSRPSEGAI